MTRIQQALLLKYNPIAVSDNFIVVIIQHIITPCNKRTCKSFPETFTSVFLCLLEKLQVFLRIIKYIKGIITEY